MTVAIVVLDHNGHDDTLECLRSLQAITFRDIRIYVVDNGSVPPLRPALVGTGIPVRLIENPDNLGFSGGNNVAIRAALADGADSVLLLNNDTVVEPGFLEPLVQALARDPGLALVVPKIYFYGQDRVLWAHGARVDRLTGRSPHIGVYEKDTGQYDSIREVDRVTGCAMLVRRSVLERVGLLDDRFFAYSEELDWCLRMRRAGFRLAVVKESAIWHKGHRSSGRLGRPFIAYLLTRNALLVLRKHSDYFYAGGSIALAYLTLSLGFRIAWVLTVDRLHKDEARAIVRGIVDYWRGRFGRPMLG